MPNDEPRVLDPAGVVFGVGVPVAAAVVGLLLTYTWMDRLPDRLATHWSTSMPDGFSSPTSFAWTFALITLLIGGGCSAVAALAAALLVMRRAMLLTGLTVVGLLTTLQVAILATQLDVADASSVRLPGWAIGGGVALGFCVGCLGARFLTDYRPRPPARGVPDANLPRASRETVTDTVGFGPWGIGVFVVVCVVAGLVASNFVGSTWPLAAAAPLVVIVVAVMRYRVTVDADGVRVTNLGMTSLDVGIAEIEGARVIEVSPFKDFGGWGLRTKGRGRYAIATRSGPAVQVSTAGALTLTVTSDRAETMAGAINAWADSFHNRN